jgi:hypothetical protein
MDSNFDGAGTAPQAPIRHDERVKPLAVRNFNFDGANDNPDAKFVNNKAPRPSNPLIADAKNSQPWQSAEAIAKATPFLRKGEKTVLDLIANAGITLHDILTLSHSELSVLVDEGRNRIEYERQTTLHR